MNSIRRAGEIVQRGSSLAQGGSQSVAVETGKMLTVARRMLRGAPERITEEESALWASVLQMAGVDSRDILPALTSYMASNSWFPAPAQIIEHCRIIQGNRFREAQAIREREQAERAEIERLAEQERRDRMTPEEREREDAEKAQRIAEIRARLIKAGVLDPPITDGPSVPIADQAYMLRRIEGTDLG